MDEKERTESAGTTLLGMAMLVVLFASIWTMVSGTITIKDFFIVTLPLTIASLIGKKYEAYWTEAFAGFSAISIFSGTVAVLKEYNFSAGWEEVVMTTTLVCYGIYLYKKEGMESLKGFTILFIAVTIFYYLF